MWFRRWRDQGQRAAQQRVQLRRAAGHHGRRLLLQTMARWKAHHLGCVRKRVRQAAAPQVPLCGGSPGWATTTWGRGGLSGRTHDHQDGCWVVGVQRPQGCRSLSGKAKGSWPLGRVSLRQQMAQHRNVAHSEPWGVRAGRHPESPRCSCPVQEALGFI